MNKRYQKVLVTGGAGFIGSFLVDALIEKGFEVIIFDNLTSQVHNGRKPKYLNKEAKFIRGDVRDYNAMKRVIQQSDAIYHLAAAVGVGQSNYQIKEYVDTNIGGTANLSDILVNQKHHVKKVVVASSMTGFGEGSYKCKKCGVVRPAVRGEKQLKKRDWNLYCPKCSSIVNPAPTDESAQEFPSSIYAITKKAQWDLLLLIGSLYKIPTVALKFFNVYGPRQSLSNPYTGVTAIFISRLKNNKEAIVYEDGKQSRDFVSVHDVVEALILALESKEANYQSFNIGSGIPTSILEIANNLAKFLDKERLVNISGEYRKNDLRHCYADIRKARKVLNWKPRVTLQAGLKELIEWSIGEQAIDKFSSAEKELKDKGL